ncbi:TIGR02391 family protein [Leptothoe sp. PORK10 BA2]|uniref:TIGR02391 family protein n=1 Tax=Leptothoe sp. PORK10 BA2 TaxID=3110254 RepID=UPI002B215767|nr:TIGR02391 family protein [Leptothoe sp. PORK10 BA2]MEA5464224.1 TIGR02391 family protein [Leptothoe sp. PORK10 BA2]
MLNWNSKGKLADVQYNGRAGITRSCLNAILRFINFGDEIEEVRLLTYESEHCFLLSIATEGYIMIKSGFSSGYHGEGPRGLSLALQILQRYVSWIEEYRISSRILQNINNSCLSHTDLDEINSTKPVVPYQVHEYIYATSYAFSDDTDNDKRVLKQFPWIIPLGLIDHRIMDLAIKFRQEPDLSLMSAYRRLEDTIRQRTGLNNEIIGAKLFSKVFRGKDSLLHWRDIESAEREGRAALFEGTYMAFRNRRAHREFQERLDEGVREFLLLNELFLLEAQAINQLPKQNSS